MNFSRLKLISTAGFALFAMFFGSGNLLYPLSVGVSTGADFGAAWLGLLLTAVLVPFLGLIATILSAKKGEDFFAPLGRGTSLVMGLLTLSLMGPFGVGARCILVATAGVKRAFPFCPEMIVALSFLGVCAFFLLRKGSLVQSIGRVLTPFLLVGLLLLITGSFFSPAHVTQANYSFFENLSLGALEGYQMMDLLAAIYFGRRIHLYLAHKMHSFKGENTARLSLYSGALGAFLLAFLYTGLVAVGSRHGSHLFEIDPSERLAAMAELVFGPFALALTACVIALACLTTLCVLVELFADFLRTDLLRDKITRKNSLLLTLAVTFLVSLTGFFTLASWIGFALSWIYPLLILYTVFRLFSLRGEVSSS